MKIVLKTGQEYEVLTVFETGTNQICISFSNVQDYGLLRSTLTDEALKEIKYYTTEENFIVYEDYAKFIKSNVTETETGLDIAMYFEKDSEVVLAIKKLQNTNEDLMNDLEITKELNDNAVAEITIMIGLLFGLLSGGN